MQHIPQESVAEYIRQTLSPTEASQVREHVAECRECSDLIGLFREVMRVGANETAYEPPPGTVRIVNAYFGTQHPGTARTKRFFELLFDSFGQPAMAGARASVASARQLLYRVGTVYVDMRVDSEVNSERAALVGQMLDSARPGHPVSGVPVVLLDGRKNVASAISNNNGEFQIEFLLKNNLRLSVTVGDGAPVYLPITGVEERRRPGGASRGPN